MLVGRYKDILAGLAGSGNALLGRGHVHHIAQMFGQVLIAHLVKVIVPLFIGHDHKAKHFFSGQRYSVLQLFWCATIWYKL